MKRVSLLLFFLFLLAVTYASAQSSPCQYTDIETYSENEMVLTYENSSVIAGKVATFSDFSSVGNKSWFMIFNPNEFRMVVMLNYTVEGHAAGNRNYGIEVKPKDYAKAKEDCFKDGTQGPCFINSSSITYSVFKKPDYLYPKLVSVQKIRNVVNKPCKIDSECGTGICNIASFCGDTKVVPCCEGKNNCNNEFCFLPHIKQARDAYQCDWECESGVGVDGICKWDNGHSCIQPTDCLSGKCNFAGFCGPYMDGQCPNGTQNCNDQQCLKPSSKTIGEAYSCVWECESGAGKDWVCQMSLIEKAKRFFIFVAIIALIYAIARYFYWKGDKAKKEREVRIKEYEKQIAEAQQKLAGIEKETASALARKAGDLAKLNRERDKITADLKNVRTRLEAESKSYDLKIEELEKEFKNADQRAKQAVGIQIANLRAKNEARLSQLDKEKKKIEEQEEENKAELGRIKSQFEQEKAKLEEEKIKIANLALEKNALQLQQRKDNLFINELGYIQFKHHKDGVSPGLCLHDYVAEKKIFRPKMHWFKEQYPNKSLRGGGLLAHHIDDDKFNNAKENLAIISKMEHDKINNTNIPKGDWDKGIQILKELGIRQPHIPELRTRP